MTSAMQHLSIRVPWHDTAWDGRICSAPSLNESCLVLPRLREERLRTREDGRAGPGWEDARSELPPCVRERVGFMRDREFSVQVRHPYTGSGSAAHDELKPLRLRF